MAATETTYTRPAGSTGDALLGRRGRAIASILSGRRCPVCGRRYGSGKRREMQIDHLVPCAEGGDEDRRNNLVPLCGQCNASKGKREVVSWLIDWAPRVGATKAKRASGIARAAHTIAGELLELAATLTRELDAQDAWVD